MSKDMTRVVILQSNYIPWKGYFDLIAAADEFVIFDEVQFTRRDWRNRNIIVNGGRKHWLTIPVVSKGEYDSPISQIKIADSKWALKHWQSLRHAYGKSAYFKEIAPILEDAYRAASELELLTEVNELFLRTLCKFLDLRTHFSRSDDVPRRSKDATDRLLEICLARGATTYVSGPAAKAYISRQKFANEGIELAYADYSGYPTYDQQMNPFEHGVSVVDLLFRFGRDARAHLKTVSSGKALYQVEAT